MNTSPATIAFPRGDSSRTRRMIDEFQFAISQLDRNDMKQFGWQTAKSGLGVAWRRGKNFTKTIFSLAKFGITETGEVAFAIYDDRLKEHIAGKVAKTVTWCESAAGDCRQICKTIVATVRADPKKEAPKLLAFVLGLAIGSGGADGDGGVPDLDLIGGIGRHRSIFTHSVFAGIVIEITALMLVDLTSRLHRHLPVDHDPFWDSAKSHHDDFMRFFSIGASMGIAYHLAIDGTIDSGGTFKDMPLSLPLTGHNAILWSSAATEGLDSVARMRFSAYWQQISSKTKAEAVAPRQGTQSFPANANPRNGPDGHPAGNTCPASPGQSQNCI